MMTRWNVSTSHYYFQESAFWVKILSSWYTNNKMNVCDCSRGSNDWLIHRARWIIASLRSGCKSRGLFAGRVCQQSLYIYRSLRANGRYDDSREKDHADDISAVPATNNEWWSAFHFSVRIYGWREESSRGRRFAFSLVYPITSPTNSMGLSIMLLRPGRTPHVQHEMTDNRDMYWWGAALALKSNLDF